MPAKTTGEERLFTLLEELEQGFEAIPDAREGEPREAALRRRFDQLLRSRAPAPEIASRAAELKRELEAYLAVTTNPSYQEFLLAVHSLDLDPNHVVEAALPPGSTRQLVRPVLEEEARHLALGRQLSRALGELDSMQAELDRLERRLPLERPLGAVEPFRQIIQVELDDIAERIGDQQALIKSHQEALTSDGERARERALKDYTSARAAMLDAVAGISAQAGRCRALLEAADDPARLREIETLLVDAIHELDIDASSSREWSRLQRILRACCTVPDKDAQAAAAIHWLEKIAAGPAAQEVTL